MGAVGETHDAVLDQDVVVLIDAALILNGQPAAGHHTTDHVGHRRLVHRAPRLVPEEPEIVVQQIDVLIWVLAVHRSFENLVDRHRPPPRCHTRA
jgi:hypothetical protein